MGSSPTSDRIEAEGRAAARAFLDTFRSSDPFTIVRHDVCGGSLHSHCEGCGACFGQPHPSWCAGGMCVCGHGEESHPQWEYGLDRNRCTVKRCKCRWFESKEERRAYEEWCDSPDARRMARAVKTAVVGTASCSPEEFIDTFMTTLSGCLATEEFRADDFR